MGLVKEFENYKYRGGRNHSQAESCVKQLLLNTRQKGDDTGMNETRFPLEQTVTCRES